MLDTFTVVVCTRGDNLAGKVGQDFMIANLQVASHTPLT